MLHTARAQAKRCSKVLAPNSSGRSTLNSKFTQKRHKIMQIPTHLNRRSFVQLATVGALGAALAAPAFSATAVVPPKKVTAAAPPSKATAAVLPNLELDNPTAKALGYVEDATKVDAAKYPNHKPGQMCAGCSLMQGDAKNARNPCAIFPGKSVASKGWCASFAKKA